MTIPRDSIMSDIDAAKYRTLFLGLLVVAGIKVVLTLFSNLIAGLMKARFVFPEMRRKVAEAIMAELKSVEQPGAKLAVATVGGRDYV